MSRASQTPVMRQYLAAKAAYPDALLFFRMGDFYELFFEDAVVAARALDLTLTARNKGSGDEIPMAGVPHHAASAYVQRLLEQGFNVAICEQMADPSKVKGIVPREVVRVATPGITYDDAGIEARQNHYLAAVERDPEGSFGLAALDLSTGELVACEAGDVVSALAELVRLDPREVLFATGADDLARQLAQVRPRAVARTVRDPLSVDEADAVLDAQLGAGEARASTASTVARRAAARCLRTARACEAGRPLPVSRLAVYELRETLALDEATQSHLELVRAVDGEERGSLLHEIDVTRTAPGARLLRRRLLAPRTGVAEIRRLHDGVELFVAHPGMRAELRERLDEIGDVERLAVKLALDRAAPRDLVALRRSLAALPAVAGTLASCPEPGAREALGVEGAAAWIDACEDLHDLLARAVADDPPPRASDGGVDPRRLRRRARRGARADARRAADDRRARGAASRGLGDREPQAALHARLRLVHRGHPGPRRQGARARGGASRRSRRASASRATSSTRSPTSWPTPRSGPPRARPSSSRASSATSRRTPSGCAPSRRGWPAGTSRRRSPRWPTETTGFDPRSTTRSS